MCGFLAYNKNPDNFPSSPPPLPFLNGFDLTRMVANACMCAPRNTISSIPDVRDLTNGVCFLSLSLQEILDVCSATSSDHGGSTMIIGKHRQGHAVALSVTGQEMGGGETAYTVRSAAVREEFLLFMSDSLKVTAASQETMTMLGVSLRLTVLDIVLHADVAEEGCG